MPHETLVGGSCYTAWSARELRDRVNKASDVQVKQIRGEWIYYVHMRAANKEVLSHVNVLLQDVVSQTLTASENTSSSVTVFTTPRYISPWSSQATNIAHVCGLRDQIYRIEKGRRIIIEFTKPFDKQAADVPFKDLLHDRMTEIWGPEPPALDAMFAEGKPSPLAVVDIFADNQDALSVLRDYNQKKGLSLDESEMEYLVDVFRKLGRPPNDVELFMFAQVNSEYVCCYISWCFPRCTLNTHLHVHFA